MSTDFPKLDLKVMDSTHHEAFELLDAINNAVPHEMKQRIDAFIAHTKAHFDQEQQLMIKTGFPAIKEHEAEHNRITADVVQFMNFYKRGNTLFAKTFFKNSLPEILQNHIRQVDSALAAHIKKVTENSEKAE